MALTVDATNYVDGSAGTTVTVPLTISSASNRALVVCVGYVDNTSVSVTWNGVSMTLVKDTGAGFNGRALVFFLGNPDSGTHDVVVTKASGQSTGVGAISFVNARSTVGGSNTATGTSTAPSVTVTVSGSKGIVVDCVNTADGGALTVHASQTQFFNDTAMGSTNWDVAGSRESHTGSNVTMSWTQSSSNFWAIAALEVVEDNAPTVTVLTPSESVNIIERLSRIWNAPRSNSDVVTLQGETLGRTWNLGRSPSDIVTITETLGAFKGRIIELLESLGVNESLSRVVTYARGLTESVSVSETLSKLRVTIVEIVNQVVIIEQVLVAKVLSILLMDVVDIIEYVRTPLNWLKRTVPTTIWTPRTKP